MMLLALLCIMSGVFLTLPEVEHCAGKLIRYLLNGMLGLAVCSVAAALLLPFVYGSVLHVIFTDIRLEDLTSAQLVHLGTVFYLGIPGAALLILICWGIRYFRRKKDFFLPESWKALDYLIPFFYWSILLFLTILWPAWNGDHNFPGKQDFYRQVFMSCPEEYPVFLLGDDLEDTTFYLSRFKRQQWYQIPFQSAYSEEKCRELYSLIRETGKSGGVIITTASVLDRLPDELKKMLQEDSAAERMLPDGKSRKTVWESFSFNQLQIVAGEDPDVEIKEKRLFARIFHPVKDQI